MDTTAASNEEHREKMRRMQAEMKARRSESRTSKGLVLVHTGNGKGKSSAALGMLVRSLSHGRRCAVMQFIKRAPDRAEAMLRGPLLEWQVCGDGFTWDTQDREADIARVREGWAQVKAWLGNPEIDFVLLDEINVVLAYEYLPMAELAEALKGKPAMQHVVCTGRGAPQALQDLADLVTEMGEVKHPFKAGVKAQAGIEF